MGFLFSSPGFTDSLHSPCHKLQSGKERKGCCSWVTYSRYSSISEWVVFHQAVKKLQDTSYIFDWLQSCYNISCDSRGFVVFSSYFSLYCTASASEQLLASFA